MKDTNRASRRAQQQRIKNKAYRKFKESHYMWIDDNEFLAELARKKANHMKDCSCYMCGNPRKFSNELTIQERKHKRNLQEGCNEHFENENKAK
jgi:predicted ferric reductase